MDLTTAKLSNVYENHTAYGIAYNTGHGGEIELIDKIFTTRDRAQFHLDNITKCHGSLEGVKAKVVTLIVKSLLDDSKLKVLCDSGAWGFGQNCWGWWLAKGAKDSYTNWKYLHNDLKLYFCMDAGTYFSSYEALVEGFNNYIEKTVCSGDLALADKLLAEPTNHIRLCDTYDHNRYYIEYFVAPNDLLYLQNNGTWKRTPGDSTMYFNSENDAKIMLAKHGLPQPQVDYKLSHTDIEVKIATGDIGIYNSPDKGWYINWHPEKNEKNKIKEDDRLNSRRFLTAKGIWTTLSDHISSYIDVMFDSRESAIDTLRKAGWPTC